MKATVRINRIIEEVRTVDYDAQDFLIFCRNHKIDQTEEALICYLDHYVLPTETAQPSQSEEIHAYALEVIEC